LKLLLDTHVLLWAAGDDRRLPARIRGQLTNSANELMLSAASGWEIIVKEQAGRLRIKGGASKFLEARVREAGLIVLPVLWLHVLRVHELPLHHRDPFDRLLVAQAQIEKLPIVTADRDMARYAVEVIW